MESSNEQNDPKLMHKSPVINIAQANVPISLKSDDEIIVLFQSGEKEVFRILVERYQERIRNLIYSIFNNEQIVDDISQDIFIKVYQALSNFRFQSSFYTWLYRIAINKSRDELRKKKVKKIFTFGVFDANDTLPHPKELITDLRDTETDEIVQKMLNKLPDKYRVPIILKDIDGLSYDEIGEVVGCEVGTVKSRLSRGRAMLKELLKPYFQS